MKIMEMINDELNEVGVELSLNRSKHYFNLLLSIITTADYGFYLVGNQSNYRLFIKIIRKKSLPLLLEKVIKKHSQKA